jgi:hypothetical protein
MTGVVTAIAAAVTATATVAGVLEQKEANYQQRVAAGKQFEAQQKKADVQNVRDVRQQIRASRIATGQMQNVGAQVGATGGSALAGGVSSIGSQTVSNINYMAQIAQQNTAINAAQLEGASVTSNAAVWGAVGSLSGTIFSDMGGFKTLNKPYVKPT